MNFARELERLRNKKGQCSLKIDNYASIKAFRVNCVNGLRTEFRLFWVIEEEDKIRFLNGVTGYEVYYIKNLLESLKKNNTNDVCITSLTKDRYDGIYVEKGDLLTILATLQKK